MESKETKASKEITVTHNSVFAAHRLQCRMTIHKVDIRHFVLPFVIPSEVEESLEIFLIFEGGILVEEWNYTRAYRPNVVRGALYFSRRETCPAAS